MADNIYMKLAQMRVELQKMNIKKSGHNDYSNYDYYELADILPPINDLQEKYKTCSFISFTNDIATLRIVNAENPEEVETFTSPMAELSLKAANAVQNLGGVETYQRRYLYMAAFEIVENDYFDATQGKEEKQPQKPVKKAAPKKSQLSEATAAELNLRIKTHCAVSGLSTKALTDDIVNAIGKELKNVTEDDAKRIMNLLDKWEQELEAV